MALNNNLPDERDRAIQGLRTLEADALPSDDGPLRVTENDDGSAVVKFGAEDEDLTGEGFPESRDFLQNLADGVIPDVVLNKLAIEYLDHFDRDKDARKERDKQYAEGIQRTGLANDAPGGADFDGASRAVHPVLIEGCIEFSARSMKELFPPSGPVKTAIIGEQTDAKLEKAERKKDYMNWQLTKQIKEYRSELEQTLTQVPLGGSQYLKVWYDERVERPRVEFIPVDEMLIPFAASDFECAQRKTHMQQITAQTLAQRVDSGLYRELPDRSSGAELPDQTEAAKASDKVEGKEEDPYNEDGLRQVYECYCDLELEDDPLSAGDQRGYILTIDETTRKVLALYRNWEEKDSRPVPESLDWIVEFGFVPWRGAYKIGLAHIIGGLSAALTGTLRAILDAALLQSSPGGLMLGGARQTGKNVSGSPTEFIQLSAPPNVDDIRKLAMPYPFSGPGPVLFQVLDWLTIQAKGVVSTASEAIKDAGSDMPVGTALALIEQGSITFSAVHARLHASQRKVLGILHRINGQWLDDEVTVEELGELVVGRKDFQGPMDVMPVSDPNIFSDAQRYAQNQAALAMAEKFPQVFKIDKLIARAMKLMNYPDYEEVLNAPTQPKKIDAITENTQASEPEVQLKAYREQDHFKHLQLHVMFMVSPVFCANPMMAMPALPKLLAHCKEHLLMMYADNLRTALDVAKVVHKAGSQLPPDRVEIAAAAIADKQMAEQLAPLMPLIEKAAQLAQQFAPKPPMDPRAQAQIEVAKFKTEADAAEGEKERQAVAAIAQAKDQAESARSAQEMMVAAHNADLAAQSEQQSQNLQLALAHIRESNANLRQEFMGGVQLALKGVEQQYAQITQNVDRVYNLFESLVAHKTNLGEPVDKTILGHMQTLVEHPDVPTAPDLSAVDVSKAPPEPAPSGE